MGGSDTVVFTAPLGAGNVDAVVGFASGDDRLLLDSVTFAGLGSALPASAFAIGTAAGDADDRIVHDQASGQLWFDADGNGAGAAVLFATLDPGTLLAASDFIVV
jgi:serralysin